MKRVHYAANLLNIDFHNSLQGTNDFSNMVVNNMKEINISTEKVIANMFKQHTNYTWGC